MNLQQLKYICAVARNRLNVSAAAESLHTSQPGVSKQIRLLEEELGIQIFERSGKQFHGITEAGQAIIDMASKVLAELSNIRHTAQDFNNPKQGHLSIATTHTQARYVLPSVIKNFTQHYPQVALHMHQGTPMQISELAANGTVDFAIATEALEYFEDLVMMPCYHWNRCIIVPKTHTLANAGKLTLEALAQHPIITYVFGFTDRSKLDQAFKQHDLKPNVILTATDADVIKTYVRLGLGVGIIAKMAYLPDLDPDLTALDASHLFEHSTTKIGFRRGTYLKQYMYDFIEAFATHLTRDIVDEAAKRRNWEERQSLFEPFELPSY